MPSFRDTNHRNPDLPCLLSTGAGREGYTGKDRNWTYGHTSGEATHPSGGGEDEPPVDSQ